MIRLLFVSRPSPDKGLAVLLNSLELVRDDNWSLSIVGEIAESDKPFVQRAVDRGKRVLRLGMLSSSQVAETMRASDILLVPSLYENFGNVALEGMACGCLVIASRTGGLTDLVDNGTTGWLTNTGDPMDLAIALDISMAQKAWVASAKIAAIDKARNYSWEEIIKKTLNLIEGL